MEVMARPDQADAARALGPLSERSMMGRIFSFSRMSDREQLEGLGELHTPKRCRPVRGHHEPR